MSSQLDSALGPLLRSHAGPASSIVLACLAKCTDAKPTVIARYIASRSNRLDVKNLVRDPARFQRLVLHARNRSPLPLPAARLATARRIVGHLAGLEHTGLTPARRLKTAVVTAVIGSRILTADRGWDTTLVTMPSLALDLGTALQAPPRWLASADGDTLTVRQKRPGGGRVLAMRRASGLARTAVVDHVELVDELALAAEVGATDATPVAAAAILTASHPIWGYSELGHRGWAAVVQAATGVKLTSPAAAKRALAEVLRAGVVIDGTAVDFVASLDAAAERLGATERHAAARSAYEERKAARLADLELERKRREALKPVLAAIMKGAPQPGRPATARDARRREVWLARSQAAVAQVPEQARGHLERGLVRLLKRHGHTPEYATRIAAAIVGERAAA